MEKAEILVKKIFANAFIEKKHSDNSYRIWKNSSTMDGPIGEGQTEKQAWNNAFMNLGKHLEFSYQKDMLKSIKANPTAWINKKVVWDKDDKGKPIAKTEQTVKQKILESKLKTYITKKIEEYLSDKVDENNLNKHPKLIKLIETIVKKQLNGDNKQLLIASKK